LRRRIIAWILLAAFVLLILNLILFKVYWQLSMVIYLIVMFAFILTNKKGGGYDKDNQYEDPEPGISELDGSESDGSELDGSDESDGSETKENGSEGSAIDNDGSDRRDLKE
jgi:hypothetical protein